MARSLVSQRELAVRLGVDQSFVSKRLNNRLPITVDFIGAAAEVLGVPVARFFGDIETEIAA
jgi:transcriptional regulator with XRE-family HTH domain